MGRAALNNKAPETAQESLDVRDMGGDGPLPIGLFQASRPTDKY